MSYTTIQITHVFVQTHGKPGSLSITTKYFSNLLALITISHIQCVYIILERFQTSSRIWNAISAKISHIRYSFEWFEFWFHSPSPALTLTLTVALSAIFIRMVWICVRIIQIWIWISFRMVRARCRVKVALHHTYVYCACVDWYGACMTFAQYTLGRIVCTVIRSCSWSNG